MDTTTMNIFILMAFFILFEYFLWKILSSRINGLIHICLDHDMNYHIAFQKA